MSNGLISDVRVVGNLVFTKGFTGKPGDAATQITRTLEKLKAALEAAGTSMDHVLKATVYLADLRDRERSLNPIWRATFPDHPPARTCVQAGLSPGTLVEIEAIAHIPEKPT